MKLFCEEIIVKFLDFVEYHSKKTPKSLNRNIVRRTFGWNCKNWRKCLCARLWPFRGSI